jgi:opacity protein-like surface antigen
MRKTFLFTLCLLFSASLAIGQSFGIRAGANIANQNWDTDGLDFEPDSKTGLYVGVIAKFDLGNNLGLRAELNFSQYGTQIDDEFFGEQKTNINHLDIPIMIQYDIPVADKLGAYLAAGPQFGYALNGTYEFDGEEEDIDFDEEEYNRLDYGLAFGGGFGFDVANGKMLFLELRYYLGLANLNGSDDTDDITVNNRGFQVGLAFML